MANFLSRLFGRGDKTESGEAFFLPEDDAKTFGDIDYMRSSKVVRRTFARKRGQTEELESVRQISAMDKRDVQKENRPKQTTFTPTSSSTSSQSQFQQSSGSSNDMDMFRNMAKTIRKR
ncbi:MAG: hypothetical protein O2890_08550 [Cyanobacteria bacterium]|nr:hypothetical protein [Cyanobacteriota bacterium]MDA0866456.1 hypothetical protein [Cyanobacteriota bacterium]